MASVVLFHSVYGLRPVELTAADRLRAAGHEVVAPDLYAGETATMIEDGFALADRIGWPVIEHRAREALEKLPAQTVLVGFSMGASVVASLWPSRPDTAAVLLLHNTAAVPATVRAGLPVQLHVADPDAFAPGAEVTTWEQAARRAGAAVQVFTYPGAGHFYTDPALADHDAPAAALTWRRAMGLLESP